MCCYNYNVNFRLFPTSVFPLSFLSKHLRTPLPKRGIKWYSITRGRDLSPSSAPEELNANSSLRLSRAVLFSSPCFSNCMVIVIVVVVVILIVVVMINNVQQKHPLWTHLSATAWLIEVDYSLKATPRAISRKKHSGNLRPNPRLALYVPLLSLFAE